MRCHEFCWRRRGSCFQRCDSSDGRHHEIGRSRLSRWVFSDKMRKSGSAHRHSEHFRCVSGVPASAEGPGQVDPRGSMKRSRLDDWEIMQEICHRACRERRQQLEIRQLAPQSYSHRCDGCLWPRSFDFCLEMVHMRPTSRPAALRAGGVW